MVVIDNGGADPRQVIVTNVNRLQVEAEASSREFFISRDDEQVYHTTSEDAGATAGEKIFYLKNTSTTKTLFVGEIIVTTDTAITFRIRKVTGTATGTALTPINLNFTSTNAADVQALGNNAVTGLTNDGDIFVCRILAGGSRKVEFRDTLVLGQNNAFAIETDTTAAIEMTVDFHLE